MVASLEKEDLRIGRILVKRGLLTESQLVEALSDQLVYGGRIGTNLVEAGLMSIEVLSGALSAQLAVPAAPAHLFGSLDDQVVGLIGPDLARQYAAVPLGLQRGRCQVTMLDPEPARVMQLSKILRQPVDAYVTPELRLLYLLERYYGMDRPTRYLRLPDGGEDESGRRHYLKPTVAHDDEDIPKPVPEQPMPVGDEQRSGTQLLHAVGATGASDGLAGEPPPPAELVAERIMRVESGAAVAHLLVHAFMAHARVSMLFWVRSGMAVGCYAAGASVDRVQRLVVGLDLPSSLSAAYQQKRVVHTSGAKDLIHERIAEYLGMPLPSDVCVAPVILGGRVINLVCMHAHDAIFPGALVEGYRHVVEAASLVYRKMHDRIRSAS